MNGKDQTKKAIFFDLDDTLIETQPLYDRARAELLDYLEELGIDREQASIFSKQRSVDLVPTMGYSKDRLPQSFEDTLTHFRPQAAADEIATVRGIGDHIFFTHAKLKDGATQAIADLAPYFTLYLVTKGDAEVQQKRIDDLPFKDAFAEVFIIPDKNETTLKDIARQTGFLPSQVTMIGDSLRSDIQPAIGAGMRAILVNSANWQQHEMDGHDMPEGAIAVANLSEAVQAVSASHARRLRNSQPLGLLR